MGELTLVPSTAARAGHRFRFQGDPGDDACDGCPVRTLCFRLPAGHYEVTGVRTVEHDCAFHDGGKVTVVEARSIPWRTSQETKNLRGTATTWKPVPCGYPECANWSTCHPALMPEGRYEVVEDEGELDCPMHYKLRSVKLQPL